MYMHKHKHTHAGMSFIEVLITAAIVTLVFGGLMAAFQLSVSLIGKSKAEAGALALANEQLEYIRSLDYDSVGTVGGIPDGPIPQTATATLNGITYTERVLIAYVDSPDDGEGGDDDNAIVADYKLVKVEYSWDDKGDTESISLISNIVPRGIETTAGGGTLRVNVFDASADPVEGAAVHIYNDTGTSTIDTTRYTNVDGTAYFSGAPALANYQITVTKDDFSTDGTYSATVENPNPSPPHVSVIESAVSTVNFQIDLLADLAIRTIGEPVTESFTDTFDDDTNVADLSDTMVNGGAITLAGGPPYEWNGTARSTTTVPAVVSAWETFTFTLDLPEDTAGTVQLFHATGTNAYEPVPDADLPGNSTGFATGTISIATLDPSTYPALALVANLSTENASSTPSVLDWELGYTIDEPPISNADVTLTSGKSIGTDAGSSPVPKYEETHTSDGNGDITLTDLEWGIYNVTLESSSYDIADVCGEIPYTLAPDADDTLTLKLAEEAVYSLRVRVENTDGDHIAGASVTLSRTGFSDTDTTSSCGGVFFGTGVVEEDDYVLDVSAPGYTPESVSDIVIDGDSAQTVVLSN